MSGLFKKKQAPQQVTTTPAPYVPGVLPLLPLSWERKFSDEQIAQGPHPERAAWSKYLYDGISKDKSLWLNAKDLKVILPKADQMTETQKISALCELAVQIFKYECNWNPAATSAGVSGNSRDNQAVGFCQLSVIDQESFNLDHRFTYEELKNPYNNMQCFFGLMRYTLKATNKIAWTKGVEHTYFFETLGFGVKWLTLPKTLLYVNKYCDELLKLP